MDSKTLVNGPLPTPEEVQQEIRKTRHKKEVPLYILVIALGILGVFGAMNFHSDLQELVEDITGAILEDGSLSGVASESLGSALIALVGILTGVGSILFLLIGTLVSVYKTYGDQLSYSVRVSETNFPEIYEKVQEYTRLLGLKKAPEVFVQQMNGTLNAFTSWIPGKTFIQMNAEMVDIAYLENRDFDTVFFVMAHEFGHIYLHHVQLAYVFWSMLVNFIPVLGTAVFDKLLSRAREYSADRVGQALTGGKNQEECMMLLGVGRHLYKHVNAEEYLNNITRRPPALARLARWCTNLLASHPIIPLRVRAILDPEKKSGHLL